MVYITADFVTIAGVTIQNGYEGIYVVPNYTVDHLTLRDIIVEDNGYIGISLPHAAGYHLFEDCVIRGNANRGFYGHQFHNSVIRNCEVHDNGQSGLAPGWGYYTSIHDNVVIGNGWGIHANWSGVLGNLIYHNDLVDNTVQAVDLGTNTWDNGYPTGGNYWSDYTGPDQFNGPGQDVPGADGIGDDAYDINPFRRDHYPLMTPRNLLPPVADANGPYQGDEGALITLDGSGSVGVDGLIVLYEWDLDDDGEFDDATGVTVGVIYPDDGLYTVGLLVTDQHGLTDMDSALVSVLNVAPDVSVDVDSQGVQYSDHIADVTVTATDVPADVLTLSTAWSLDGGASFAGLPGDLSVTGSVCTVNSTQTCEWVLSGQITEPAGTYTVGATVTDDDGGATTVETEIVVDAEDATIAFDGANPVAVEVAVPGGDSGSFSLTVEVIETQPDLPIGVADFGDIANAVVSMTLAPVGPGSPSVGTCVAGAVTGVGYDAVLPVTCSFDGVPVNTYTVETTVDGGYYDGYNEDVLLVYDPSLGFTTGGGWFYWPDTDDKTNFGYTMSYNKKGTAVKGNFLLIRHLDDGSKYRVKSNALYGLAIGEADGFGWASFSGKATYLEPGWVDPIGNHEFVVYVEDHGQPGDGDRVWLEMHDKSGDVIPALSMLRDALDNTVTINGGNIVVPH